MIKIELPVNKFYFNQVKSKELIEDFRAVKPYWIKRLVKIKYRNLEPMDIVRAYISGADIFMNFDRVVFKNGYADSSPKIEVDFKGLRFTHPEEMTCMGKGIAFAIEIAYD